MFKQLFGNKIATAFNFTICMFGLTSLAGYASVFAASFASNVPLGFTPTCDVYQDGDFYSECRIVYWIYLFIFGILMLFAVIIGLKEQKSVQLVLSIMRFVIISLLVATGV